MSKADNQRMAEYILSGGSEENDCISQAIDEFIDNPGMNKSQIRKSMQEHLFYIAFKTNYGANEANKKITQMMSSLEFKKYPATTICDECFAVNNKTDKECRACMGRI